MVDFRNVYESDIVSIHRWSCDGRSETRRTVPAHGFVFTQRGVFRKSSDRRQSVVATPGSVLFARDAEQIRVTHPVAGGDEGIVIRLSDRVMSELLGEARDDDPTARMGGSTALNSSATALRLRGLLSVLGADRNHRTPDVDDAALDIVVSSLDVLIPSTRPTARSSRTREAHRAAIENVKVAVGERYRDPLTLEDLAAETRYSVFHLSRLFKAHTGVSMYRYVNRVRLVAALDILARGGSVTRTALQVGFSSSSHFSDAFQQEFRLRPVEVRRWLSDPDTAAWDRLKASLEGRGRR